MTVGREQKGISLERRVQGAESPWRLHPYGWAQGLGLTVLQMRGP